tara:strand:- start:20 stop:382 length:363 start_codon:yes stop_codon:yes gene_type:complete
MYGSKEATAVLKAMENHSIGNSSEKMIFIGKSGKYKAITGRTRVDGSITGIVHKFLTDAETGELTGNTKLAGSFKILTDGFISRWTGVPTKVCATVSGDALKDLTSEEEVVEAVTDEEAA